MADDDETIAAAIADMELGGDPFACAPERDRHSWPMSFEAPGDADLATIELPIPAADAPCQCGAKLYGTRNGTVH